MAATIKDVALKVGVAASTVSRALSNAVNVKTETRHRILQAARELNYQPNALARSLRSRQSKTFGVMVPDITNPFFAELVKGIEAAARQNGYNVILCNSENDRQRELAYLSLMREKQVDGLIFTTAGDLAGEVNTFREDSQTPVVLLDREVDGLEADTVISDGFQGAVEAVRYLLSQDHTELGCLRGPSDLTTSNHRYLGFVKTLTDAGRPVKPEWVVPCDFTLESGYEAGKKIAQLANRPTAVFAVNDLAAIGLIQSLEEAGIKVPDDISVIGFDDVPLSRLVRPRLTTVAQPIGEMGATAVKLLLQIIKRRRKQVKKVVLNTRLVIRESVRPRS